MKKLAAFLVYLPVAAVAEDRVFECEAADAKYPEMAATLVKYEGQNKGHITIGDNVRIQAQSGIGRSLKDNETVQGSPALPYSDYNKSYVHFKNLQKLADRVHELEKKLKEQTKV